MNDALLAATLAALATVPASGRFGADRVFVSALWRALDRAAFDGLTLDGFKTALVAAHRAGKLTLVRADLVAAMNPATVAASRIAVLNATFHLVLA